MPLTVKWPSLEERRKQSRLTLLFKFINKLIYIPSQYLPVLSPTMHTGSNHSLKLQYIYIYISMLEQISTVIPFYPEQYAIGQYAIGTI